MQKMKPTTIVSFIFINILILSFTGKWDERTDFSGNWALNKEKGELGDFGGRDIASDILIAQTSDSISFTKTFPGLSGNIVENETLTYDGKESRVMVYLGAAKRISILKWADDGKNFVKTYTVEFERDGQKINLKGKEVWSLIDNKNIFIETSLFTPQGEFKTKVIYDKQ